MYTACIVVTIVCALLAVPVLYIGLRYYDQFCDHCDWPTTPHPLGVKTPRCECKLVVIEKPSTVEDKLFEDIPTRMGAHRLYRKESYHTTLLSVDGGSLANRNG